MFNNTFYPTPDNVIEQMIAPHIIEIGKHRYLRGFNQILEPSAGKGNIVDYLTTHFKINKSDVYCVEIEPELQYILQSKGYKLIDSDFLSYDGRYLFDLIIMNPPFNKGVHHLLKAWEILVNGHIICLLNAETIKNPFSKERKLLLEIISKHGSVEYIGSAFADGEQSTDVEIAIVRLYKEIDQIKFEDPDFDKDNIVIDDEFIANPLAKADMIDAIVDQYNKVVEITIQRREIEKEYRFYLKGVKSFTEPDNKNLNDELSELKELFWQYIFQKTKLGQETTSHFQQKMEEFRSTISNMAFNKENILLMFDMYMQNKQEIMKQCVWSVFERATSYHKKNKIHVEGWKTNSHYKINQKIIIPHSGLTYDDWGFSLSYYRQDFFNDLDKSLCWLTGKQISAINTIEDTIRNRIQELKRSGDYRKPIFSTFFEIKFFKKGTIHLKFVDDHVWQTLNVSVSKNWLGE